MDKFTFFDFIAFVVPGGTLLILFYTWVCFNFPHWGFKANPDSVLWSIPLIFFAFVLGHLMSWLGKLADDRLIEPRCKMYVKGVADARVGHDELFLLVPGLPTPADERYSRNELYKQAYVIVENLLDVQDKNKLVVILQSQYTFFRNAMATCLFIALFFLVVLIAHGLGGFVLRGSLGLYVLGCCGSLLLLAVCLVLMITRKKLMVTRAFKTIKSLNSAKL